MSDETSRGTEREPVWRIARPERTVFDWDAAVGTLEPEEKPGPFSPSEQPAPSPASKDVRTKSIAVFLAALIGAVIGSGTTLVATNDRPQSGGVVQVAPPVTGSGTQQESVAAVAKAVLPSIVSVDVSASGPFGGRQEGTGSGVIYRSDGYILTNDHVVSGASQVQVTLADGTSVRAQVVGTAAPAVDIAVLKIDKTGLPVATLGSTKDVDVGALAVALGSPFGLQGTVTAGVISALHRNVTFGDTRFSDAIQTDAPINPGNSGGALADANGRVIGINTAIYTAGGSGNVGVGFAIPIDIARNVADQIIATGQARLSFLGVTGQNLPNNGGALIQDVVAGGPAANAGIRTGDIIVALDGQKIESMDDLISAIISKKVGTVAKVEYLRDGKRATANVRLAARPEG